MGGRCSPPPRVPLTCKGEAGAAQGIFWTSRRPPSPLPPPRLALSQTRGGTGHRLPGAQDLTQAQAWASVGLGHCHPTAPLCVRLAFSVRPFPSHLLPIHTPVCVSPSPSHRARGPLGSAPWAPGDRHARSSSASWWVQAHPTSGLCPPRPGGLCPPCPWAHTSLPSLSLPQSLPITPRCQVYM